MSKRLLVVVITILAGVAGSALVPAAAAAGVHGRAPFPTNLVTKADPAQPTGLRVDLPKPDCAARASDCADIDVLNTLDGFNLQPRISIPFSGPIDLSTVSARRPPRTTGCRGCAPLGIDQVVWEPADEHAARRVATRSQPGHDLPARRHRPACSDASGDAARRADLPARPQLRPDEGRRGEGLPEALLTARWRPGVPSATSSPRASSRRRRRPRPRRRSAAQIDASTPAPRASTIGNGGARTVFPVSRDELAWHRQTGDGDVHRLDAAVRRRCSIFPGAVGTVAFGSFSSPDYENARQVIPATAPDRRARGAVGTNTLYFNLFLPSRARAGGRLAGGDLRPRLRRHRSTAARSRSPSTLARSGIATIAINVVGHGGGPAGTLTVTRTGGAGDVPRRRARHRPGRQRHDRLDRGRQRGAAVHGSISSRDGLRQTVVDLMQLVREIQVGVDVDGDGAPTSTRRASTTSASRSAASTARARSASSRRARRRAERGGRPDHRDRSALAGRSGRSSASRSATRDAVALNAVPNADVHELQREHAAARPAAVDRHRAGRDRDPEGARPHRVGAAGGQPGRLAPSSARPLPAPRRSR